MTNKIQTVSGNNGAVAATTVAATLAATQQFSTLIAAITCAVAAATITPPTGWQQIGSLVATNPAGGTVGLFKFEQNPGALTTQTFTITSSLASIVISEYGQLPLQGTNIDASATQASANGATATIPSLVVAAFGELIVVAVGYVATAALTITLPTLGLTQDGSNISTAGAANGAVHLLSNLVGGISPFSGSLTLSGTPTDGPSIVAAAIKNYVSETSNGNVGPNTYSGQ